MSHYSLAKLVHFCPGRPTIFLDLDTDQYFTLPLALDEAFDRWRREEAVSDADMEALTAQRVLCLNRSGQISRPSSPSPLPQPDRSLIEEAGSGLFSFSLAVRMLFAFAATSLSLRQGRLAWLLMASDRTRPPQTHHLTEQMGKRFLATRPFVPWPPVCLRDSLVLARWLRSAGAPCHLVLGVKRDPFAAHAWVQSGACVLNDAVDNVRGFAPILVA